MSEWEPFDEELAGALRRRAGPVGGDQLATDAAHRNVLARASAVRRRRATAAGGGALAILLVGGLLLLDGGGGTEQLAPGSVPDTTAGVTPVPSRPVAATSVPATVEWTAPGTTSVTNPAPTSEPIAPVATTTVPGVAPTTSATTSSTSPSTSTAAPSNTTPPGQYPYSTTGGSIVVGWDGTALSLVSVTAAPGYDYRIEDEQADRIRVRFEGDGDDHRIECRLDDGRLVRVE